MRTTPGLTVGREVHKKTGCGNIYVTINFKDGKFHNLLIVAEGKNNCSNSMNAALADTLTFAIRRAKEEGDLDAIYRNLHGQSCNNCPANEEHISSCADAVARVIKEVLIDKKYPIPKDVSD